MQALFFSKLAVAPFFRGDRVAIYFKNDGILYFKTAYADEQALSTPGAVLPSGGALGAILKKLSADNFDIAWSTINWGEITGTLADQADLQAALDAKIDDTEIATGKYTPALTNVANLDASTAYQCQWLRIGDMVTVSGKVDVDPTLTAISTQLGIALPVASDLTAAENCAGVAACPAIANQSAAILGDITNNRAQMQWIAGDVTNQPMYFTFTYQIK